MEPQNKERLVGLGVLGFAIAISAPWFIEQAKSPAYQDPPTWPAIEAMAPELDEQLLESELTEKVAEAEFNVDEMVPEVVHPLPAPVQSYSVQLATFTAEDKATELQSKLKKAGFSAYTVETSGINGPVVKVLVGPHLNRKEAETMQTRLETRFQMRGFVVGYDPVNA